MPRSCWCASTASPRPSAMPTGTVMNAKQERRLHAVDELLRREDVAVLVEADVLARQPRERRVAEEAEVHVVHQRPEHEDAEDHERRDQQQVGEARARGAGFGAGGRRDRCLASLGRRAATSGPRPGRRSRDRTRATRGGRRRGRWCSPRGGGLVRVLAHDHELLVDEPADHVALVTERLDHGHQRGNPLDGIEAQVFGPHADHDLLEAGRLDRGRQPRDRVGCARPGSRRRGSR